MTSPAERRYSPRRAVQIVARLRVLGLGRDIDRMQLSTAVDVDLRDVGLQGVRIELSRPVVGGLSLDRLDPAAQKPVVFLQWEWPDGSGRMRAVAEAVYVGKSVEAGDRFSAGLRLTVVREKDLAGLMRFLGI